MFLPKIKQRRKKIGKTVYSVNISIQTTNVSGSNEFRTCYKSVSR